MNVDVTVWRLVADPSLLYVSTRPEGGSWRTVNTPLDMSALSSSGNFHESNAVRVAVPLAALPTYTCIEASGHTPLHSAVHATNTQLVRVIAASCPQYLDRVSDNYFYDQTPLSLAVGRGDSGIVQILINAGADPDTKINPAFRVGTHLAYAIGLNEDEIVQILLDGDADPNVIDTEQFYNQTPLSLAIKAANEDLLRNLIAAGADPNQKINPAFRVGTHLTYAVGLGDTNIVQILLDAEADPNVIDTEQFYEESALSLAVKAQDTALVRILVDAGADPNQKLDQFNDVSPLDIASEEGYTEIVKILLGGQSVDPGPAPEPSLSRPSTPTTPTDGDCSVGLVVSAGESCVYPGTSAEFSVDSAGRGHFLTFTSGTSISLQDTQVNGVPYNFEASRQADGTWIITAVGS